MQSQNFDNKNGGECQRKEDLVTYLYGEATSAQEDSFKQHLKECRNCEQELKEFGFARQTLQTWEVIPPLPMVLELGATQPRSLRAIFQELAAILPAWFKYGTGLVGVGAALLLCLAIFNTQIHYNKEGFSFQTALYNGKTTIKEIPVTNSNYSEEATKTLVAKMLADKQAQFSQELEAKRAQIEQDIQQRINRLTGEMSEKNSSELSKTSLELKRQQRSELERLLKEMDREPKSYPDDEDPFNLWGGVGDKPNRQSKSENSHGAN